MKYSCDVIKDLLPLYHDDVCSDATKDIIVEHLEECEDCKEYYKKMCSSDVVEYAAFDEKQEKKMAETWKKLAKKSLKIVIIVLLIVLAIPTILVGLFIGNEVYLSKPKVNTNIKKYEKYRSGENAKEGYKTRFEMNERIWPETITEDMNVVDYQMVHADPWDAEYYLGYLVVDYDDEGYEKEINRLSLYDSDDYYGIYSAVDEEDYELITIEADKDNGFIYALTDGENRIIYAQQVFRGGYLDVDYEEYIPKEYLLDGFNAKRGNSWNEKKYAKTNEVRPSLAKYGLTNYKKDELINELKDDVTADFDLLPDNKEAILDSSYVTTLNNSFSGAKGFVILRAKYNDKDYYSEIARIKEFSPSYDENSYETPAYVLLDGEDKTYEYALIDEGRKQISYVILVDPNISEMKSYKEFLKENKNLY